MSCGVVTGEDLGKRAQMTGEAQICLFFLGRAGKMPLSAWMVALQQHSSGGWGDQQGGADLYFFTSWAQWKWREINAITQPLWLHRQTQRARDHPTCLMSTEARPRPFENGSNFQGWIKSLIFKSRWCRKPDLLQGFQHRPEEAAFG